MKFEQIINDLKNQVYHPVYFLTGEEPFYIDQISDYIADNVLSDIEKEFNQTVVYGRDTDIPSIISYAKRFPMMSNYQVVIVKEAQNISDIEGLQSYVENPLKSTLLVICYKYKKLDKRKSFSKCVDKKGVLFESAKLYDNELPAWITSQLAKKGYKILPEASVMLAEYLGSDLSKIASELSKLIINIPPGTTVNSRHIEDNIGISKDFNIFELQKALITKDVFKANRIVNYFAANPRENPFVVTISILFSFFSKMLIFHSTADKSKNNLCSVLGINPYFFNDYQTGSKNYPEAATRKIIAYLREYDMKSKGVDNNAAFAEDGELLKELVFKIMH
jgi:DNA polymerase III subunit delta